MNLFQNNQFIEVKNRGLITVSGSDSFKFLQNLITNDLNKLKDEPSIYACFLTAQGKFLFDFFVTKNQSAYFIDCEGSARAEAFAKKLNMYRLRSAVEISCEPQKNIYLSAHGAPDPRHPDLGCRSFERPNGSEIDFNEWDKIRITLGLPDGSRDAELEKSTLAELNIEDIAVSYTKGCYLGQELTARMHHRGLGRKRLQPLGFAQSPPAFNEPIIINKKEIGVMRSSCESVGLGLIKDEFIEFLGPKIDGFYQA